MADSSQSNDGRDALSDNYARALFDAAQEAGALADVADEIAGIAGLLANDPKLSALFAHRSLDADRRARTIDAVFRGRVSETMRRFLQVLNAKGRLGHTRAIAGAFDRLMKVHRGEVDVDVYTASALSGAQLAAVSDRLSAAIGRKAVARPHVDASLIGGLKLRVGDRLIDASVASRLRKMKARILDKGHELSREDSGRLLEEA